MPGPGAPDAHGMEGGEPRVHCEGVDEVRDGHDPTDGGGPSGPPPGPELPPGARRRRVEFSAVKIGEDLAESEVILARQTKFLAAPARGEPKAEQ
eukprot:1691608-Pyramimonas_sp.AAC.1